MVENIITPSINIAKEDINSLKEVMFISQYVIDRLSMNRNYITLEMNSDFSENIRTNLQQDDN